MRLRAVCVFALLLTAVFAFSAAAQASSFEIYSGATGAVGPNQVESNNLGANVCITPVSVAPDVWATPQGSSCWVSFTNTGQGGTAIANGTTVSFLDVLTLPGTESYNVSFTVYADDTTGVTLDNVLLFGPTLTSGTYCASAPIGCIGPGAPLASTGKTFNLTLTPGVHTLQFDTVQVAGDGFGLLFDGQASTVPEPGSLMLLGSGVAGIAGLLRRKLRL